MPLCFACLSSCSWTWASKTESNHQVQWFIEWSYCNCIIERMNEWSIHPISFYFIIWWFIGFNYLSFTIEMIDSISRSNSDVFLNQPFFVHCWTSIFLLVVHRLCGVIEGGGWATFCHAGSGRVGRVWSAREKSLEILRRGWELNPGHREDRQWAIPLSYHDWLTDILGVCN